MKTAFLLTFLLIAGSAVAQTSPVENALDRYRDSLPPSQDLESTLR